MAPESIKRMEKTKVAFVGLGTVGTGVARLLLDHGERTTRHAGRSIWLEKAVVRDLNKPRDVELPEGVLTDRLEEVTDNDEIECVVQLVGGVEAARSIMIQLLESGKDVVTANKALLAEYGAELFDRARELGRSIAFDAAVAGGIPIVTNIGQCLSANRIESIHGILNGTCNFIISQMEEQGISYHEAVEEAQRRGYAEADPAMDVDGSDAAQKLAILSHLAFGARVHWKDISRQGIETLSPTDLRFAGELGYRLKSLAVARLEGDELELHVGTQLVRRDSPLAEVGGAYNAIRLVGDAVGRVWFHGMGAGRMPTASAVVADLIDSVVGRTAITFRTLQLWSERPARVLPKPSATAATRYYLRFTVQDHPGVLADITGALSKQGISIASFIQHEQHEGPSDRIPLIIMTHQTTVGAADRALAEIHQLEMVHEPAMRLRILD